MFSGYDSESGSEGEGVSKSAPTSVVPKAAVPKGAVPKAVRPAPSPINSPTDSADSKNDVDTDDDYDMIPTTNVQQQGKTVTPVSSIQVSNEIKIIQQEKNGGTQQEKKKVEDSDIVMNDDLLGGSSDSEKKKVEDSDDSDSSDSELDRVQLPPEPEDTSNAVVDPDLDERIRKFLDMKQNGKHLNDAIVRNRDYSNPYILEKIIELFQVDEYASNFPKDRFNPDMYKNLI